MSVITKDLGIATAYGYAKSKGYTGTEEEFAELMASYADVAQQAETAAQDAEDAKDAAVSAKNDAQSAQAAAESAQTAAAGSAQTASTKATEASNSAQAASGSATAAGNSATAAAGSATTAQTAAQTATTKASEASSSASAASTAKTGAETARTGAQTAQAAAETAQENAEEAAASVSASAAQIDQNTADIGQIKNDLSEKADKSEALSAYIVETETGSIASFTDGADDVPVKDLTIAIEPVQSGSGDPSPSNVRPISGWTGANVTDCGVNVWDEQWENGYYNLLTGVKETASDRIRNKNKISVVPNASFCFIKPQNKAVSRIIYYDANGTFLRSDDIIITGNDYTIITIPSDVYFICFNVGSNYGTTYNHDISINYPSTDTTYHAYNGSSVSVDWTAEAGTVYGGTLDVTTGVLTVDRAMVDLGTLNWSYNQAIFMVENSIGAKSRAENAMCSKYVNSGLEAAVDMPDKTYQIMVGSYGLWLKDTSYSDVNSFKTAMSGVQLVYEVATPQTYQLTPEEVKTVLGQNNIFADTGNVTVQYRADTKLYIDKVLSQA